MAKRRKIVTDGLENFRISETNPNASMGLPGCACGSWECKGPYIVFPNTRIAGGGRRGGVVSISASCAKAAVLRIERGDEIGRLGTGRVGEDGKPSAPADMVNDPDNPYYRTGVDINAKPLDLMEATPEPEEGYWDSKVVA